MSSRHERHEEYDPTCGECVQEAATEAFQGTQGPADVVTCPACGVEFDPASHGHAVRVTESVDTGAAEAHINGEMSFDDVRGAVETALRTRLTSQGGDPYECWAYVTDLTATDAVYSTGGDLYQCSYEIDATGTVTLGDPSPVVRTYAPAPGGESDGEGDGDMAAAEAGFSWDSSKHPRGKKGTSGGGQFAPLSYDSKTKTGSGYGKAKGDPNVRALQKELNRLGATDGKGNDLLVDGKLGPLTTSSIKKAQRALGLPANGKVTPELLARLKKAKSIKGPGPRPGKPGMKKPGPQAPKAKATTAKKVVKEAAAEERTQMVGRILEAKGEDEAGNRIFGVRIIAYGDSKNRRRYPEAVMREAAPLYEGAKAYDHHRTDAELQTSTIVGLIGMYRNVEATTEGLDADLHLLPGATHAAEALDASIAAQAEGLAPLIGLSHDVMARFRHVAEGGVQVQEATAITQVNSADLVADPAAGGKATRMVAGGQDGTGTEPAENEEGDVPATKDEILAAFAEASDDELKAVGLARAAEATEDEDTTEDGERETESRETEAAQPKGSFVSGLMIREKVRAAGLPEAVVEGVTAALPDRIVESDIDHQIAALKTSMGLIERAGLSPTVASTKVTQESIDKKAAALDAFFAGDYSKGYRSFKEAFADFTGRRPKAFDEDFNRVVLRESMGVYDSSMRASESADSTTWNLVLGDSITRRMVAEYGQPSLQTWRQIVSSIVPVNDFRTQRIDRLGGYGVLPTVNQGAPYQPLTTPGNEEVTYALSKKGGTEDITLEMIANDDVRAIAKIPTKLGLAASQTLFRFVWDFFNPASNPTIYDGTGLWTGHNNAATAALSSAAVSAGRLAMRAQTAYGDTTDVLSMVPRNLIVVNDLEELAFQLTTSAVALPSGAPTGAASNTPNLHSGLNMTVVDYWASTTGWLLVGDPNLCPTFELGFYNGRQDPEMFTQSDPSVGSMFDADKITYKIRHIYSGAVLDYRAFYRGNS